MSEFKTVTEALGTGALALAPKATEAPPPPKRLQTTRHKELKSLLLRK